MVVSCDNTNFYNFKNIGPSVSSHCVIRLS